MRPAPPSEIDRPAPFQSGLGRAGYRPSASSRGRRLLQLCGTRTLYQPASLCRTDPQTVPSHTRRGRVTISPVASMVDRRLAYAVATDHHVAPWRERAARREVQADRLPEPAIENPVGGRHRPTSRRAARSAGGTAQRPPRPTRHEFGRGPASSRRSVERPLERTPGRLATEMRKAASARVTSLAWAASRSLDGGLA